jgi:hypothetical protein
MDLGGGITALKKPGARGGFGHHVLLRGRGLAVVSVAGGPLELEARRVWGQFQGPEAQGPPPPGALTAPWSLVANEAAPGPGALP